MFESLVGTTLINAILLIIVAEAAVIYWLHRRYASGPGLARVLFNLLSGASLLLALRASLAGDDVRMILVWLSAALIVHLLDLRQRWME